MYLINGAVYVFFRVLIVYPTSKRRGRGGDYIFSDQTKPAPHLATCKQLVNVALPAAPHPLTKGSSVEHPPPRPHSLAPTNQRRTPISITFHVQATGIALQGYAPSLFTASSLPLWRAHNRPPPPPPPNLLPHDLDTRQTTKGYGGLGYGFGAAP